MMTLDKLTRHLASRHHHKPQIIGLLAKNKETTSICLSKHSEFTEIQFLTPAQAYIDDQDR